MMSEFVSEILHRLVTQPDGVHVSETSTTQGTLIEVRVAKEDLGRVIGKQGRTITALRTLATAVALRQQRRVIISVVE